MRASSLLPAAYVLSIVMATLSSVPLPKAEAKPEYATKEGKACAYCHVAAKGGGPRTPKGIEYGKNNHKFLPEAKGYGEGEAFASENNAKAFASIRTAIGIEHWSEALRRLTELRPKEKKGTKGQDLILNTETQVDTRGRDLLRAAKDAIQGGKAAEAAEAINRVEAEFKGRDAAKDVAAVRAELVKLPGGKEADVAAKAAEPQRIRWLDAQMKAAEGDKAAAIKILEEIVAKAPAGPFTEDAKKMLEQLKGAPAGGAPAMGG